MALPERAKAVLDYWFGQGYEAADASYAPRDRMPLWFGGGPEVDAHITATFGGDVEAAAAGAYDGWKDAGPLPLLAGIIIMDQFTRNIYRGSPKAFSLDGKAIEWSEHTAATGADKQLPGALVAFAYMPYMHSEELAMQERGVQLFAAAAAAATAAAGGQAPPGSAAALLANNAKYAAAHRDVVAKWGRFPHRNATLGRPSTEAEAAGLADGSIARW